MVPSSGSTLGPGRRTCGQNILSPTGIAVSDTGEVYAASMFGNEIARIDAWTREQSQFLAVGGPATVELRGKPSTPRPVSALLT